MKIRFKKYTLATTFLSAVFLTGCGTTAIKYDYGDYAESYYSYKKEPGENSLKEWKSAMTEVVSNAKEKDLRVPPGIYANLGYLALKENNNIEAITYFKLEKQTYPQATRFMNNLIQKAEKANGGELS